MKFPGIALRFFASLHYEVFQEDYVLGTVLGKLEQSI